MNAVPVDRPKDFAQLIRSTYDRLTRFSQLLAKLSNRIRLYIYSGASTVGQPGEVDDRHREMMLVLL